MTICTATTFTGLVFLIFEMFIFMVFSEITFLTESMFVEILSSVLDLNISYILVMCELHVKYC